MKNNNVLIGTAMLTAIWDKTHKDNLELLKPFVVYLVGKNTNIGDEINILQLIKEMDKEFGFYNIPKAVIIKIFHRMKDIVKRNNNKYYLSKDLANNVEIFEANKIQIRNESDKVIEKLMEYLKASHKNYNNITIEETKLLLYAFLEQNGFVAIENIDNLRDISEYKKDQANYYIAKFIIKEDENESEIFQYIYKIVCGFMLANTIYIQVENDNKASLKNVDCYLDTPLILNILGLKTNEQYVSSMLLVDLLEEKQAKIKCFEHTYNELYSIIYAYKENINNYRERTLEGLDVQNYSASDVERILSNLKKMLRDKHIKIEEKPNYDDYDVVIDEKGLEEFLKEKYKDNVEKAIRLDVESISSIVRLRKGKQAKKIEECKAIFVTTNYALVNYSNNFLKQREFKEIGYSISDVELTTILWLKNFKNNPELPKLKLIENARLSLEPSNQIIERFKDVVEKMKRENLINDVDVLENLTTNLYYKTELMEKIQGDSDNITDNVVKGIIAKESENLKLKLDVANEKIIRLQKEKEINECKIEEEKNRIDRECKNKAQKITDLFYDILNLLVYIVLILVLIYCIIIFFKTENVINYNDGNTNRIILFLIDIIGLIDMMVPRLNGIKRLLKKAQKKLNVFLYNKFLRIEKDRRKELYDLK